MLAHILKRNHQVTLRNVLKSFYRKWVPFPRLYDPRRSAPVIAVHGTRGDFDSHCSTLDVRSTTPGRLQTLSIKRKRCALLRGIHPARATTMLCGTTAARKTR